MFLETTVRYWLDKGEETPQTAHSLVNSPLGRLHPMYQKLNNYMDGIYEDAEENRATNGCKFARFCMELTQELS